MFFLSCCVVELIRLKCSGTQLSTMYIHSSNLCSVLTLMHFPVSLMESGFWKSWYSARIYKAPFFVVLLCSFHALCRASSSSMFIHSSLKHFEIGNSRQSLVCTAIALGVRVRFLQTSDLHNFFCFVFAPRFSPTPEVYFCFG